MKAHRTADEYRMARLAFVAIGTAVACTLSLLPAVSASALTTATTWAEPSVGAPASQRVARSFPTASNTGVPKGTKLRVIRRKRVVLKRPGQVLDRVDIRGYVHIQAPNVVIKRSIIRGPAKAPNRAQGLIRAAVRGARNFRVEDVTIAPTVVSPYYDGAKIGRPGVFNRVNISRTTDGMKIFGNRVRVFNSYIHGLTHFANDPNFGGRHSHDDAIQIQGGSNITIANNRLEGGRSATVILTQDHSRSNSVSILNNLISRGGCALIIAPRGPTMKGIRLANNVFVPDQYNPNCAITHTRAHSNLLMTNNTWSSTGHIVQDESFRW